MSKTSAETKPQTMQDQAKTFVGDDGKPMVVVERAEEPDKGADKGADKEPEIAAKAAEKSAPEQEVKADEDADKSPDKGADKTDDSDAVKKRRKSADERFAEITRARREAERAASAEKARADELEARLAAVEKGLTPKKEGVSSDAAPDPTKFEYGEVDPAYVSALAKFEANRALAAFRAEQEQTRQAEAAARQAQEQQTKADAVLRAGLEKFDDFEAVVFNNPELESAPAPSKEAAEAIMTSPAAAEILYHLGKNPKEAVEMAGKSPIEQARYIGRLEERYTAQKAASQPSKNTATKAPPPLGRARGSDGKFAASDNTSDFAEFMAKHGHKL